MSACMHALKELPTIYIDVHAAVPRDHMHRSMHSSDICVCSILPAQGQKTMKISLQKMITREACMLAKNPIDVMLMKLIRLHALN